MAKYDTKIREEELKNKVAEDWFGAFETSRIVGNIDFAVDIPATELALGFESEPALWAEAKAGVKKNIVESFVQLILTIGKAKLNDELPPYFLGAFDAEKIAFIPYNTILGVLNENDFNWNVTPSDHESKEFKALFDLVADTIEKEKMLFDFEKEASELKRFIRINFRRGRTDVSKLRINKNNFTHIYRKWRESVYPFIDAPWDMLKKKYGIYDRDFYLAEINVDDKDTADISDDSPAREFYIHFRGENTKPYRMTRHDTSGLEVEIPFGFKEGGLEAYAQFWRRYKRPPKKEYWQFIVNRLDLLVPQDVRERKGSFFTPNIWVEKSQQYLAQALGENWQDEYYIWDCAGGTGNLEVGLTNKYNIFMSTLDQQDVDVVHQTLGDKGSKTLLDSHVFQFDFLNDDLNDEAKVPAALREIINDEEKRKKLLIYINPPYAEGDNRKGVGRRGVAADTLVVKEYSQMMGYGKRELYIQFLARIKNELAGCLLGEFSTLKLLQAPKFNQMRDAFDAALIKMFVVPADTFDNVKGDFPIGFKIWNTNVKREVSEWPDADVYDAQGCFLESRKVMCYDGKKFINDWVETFIDKEAEFGDKSIGTLLAVANDFQHCNTVNLADAHKPWNHQFQWQVSGKNLIPSALYFAVRLCTQPSWINDRDQFLMPDNAWKLDEELKANALVYLLFHGQNRVSASGKLNHWIPFAEIEVDAKERFASHFMSDYIAGKLEDSKALTFSPEAVSVLDAGRELWRYYHSKPGVDVNASYYDIRKYFQGTKVMASGKGQMNSTSSDEKYNELNGKLKSSMKRLAARIEPKVYEYGFLKR